MNHSEDSLKEAVLRVRRMYHYIQSQFRIILVVGIFGAGFGFVYAWSKTPVYTAEITFVLEDSNGNRSIMGQLGGLAGLAGIDVSSGEGLFQGDNILELYRSRNMIEKTLLSPIDSNSNELLIDRYITINKMQSHINNINFKTHKDARRADSLVSLIVKDVNNQYLTVSRPDKKLSIISVKVKSVDEIFAKKFAETIVNNVNSFYVDTKTKKSLETVKILQQKTDSVKAAMNNAIQASAVGIDATPNLNPARQILRTSSQRSQFNVEASKAILGELIRNLEFSKMTLRSETPLIQLIDKPVLPLEKSKLSKLKSTIIGGVLSGMLITLFLLGRFILKTALKDA